MATPLYEGIIELRQGRTASGVALLEQAVDDDPEDAEARAYLGVAYGCLGRLDAAIRVLQEAVQLAPESAALRYNLGCAFQQAGEDTAAAVAYREALERDPGYERARAALALFSPRVQPTVVAEVQRDAVVHPDDQAERAVGFPRDPQTPSGDHAPDEVTANGRGPSRFRAGQQLVAHSDAGETELETQKGRSAGAVARVLSRLTLRLPPERAALLRSLGSALSLLVVGVGLMLGIAAYMDRPSTKPQMNAVERQLLVGIATADSEVRDLTRRLSEERAGRTAGSANPAGAVVEQLQLAKARRDEARSNLAAYYDAQGRRLEAEELRAILNTPRSDEQAAARTSNSP